MRARTRRVYGLGLSAIFVLAALAIALFAIGQNANLFYTPHMLLERGMPETGRKIRIGGYVEQGSLRKAAGAEIRFTIIDGSGETVRASYTGLVPDLFREGEGVVATGRFEDASGLFSAESILAKHDESYQPRELEGVQRPQTASEERYESRDRTE